MLLPLRLLAEFRLEHLRDLTPKNWDIIVGRRSHNVPLHSKIRMDGDVTERDGISPFNLRVLLTKCLREACSCFANHGELLERGGLVEFAGQEETVE